MAIGELHPSKFAEVYGPVIVSTVVGDGAYSKPRQSGLALDDYEELEVALLFGPEQVYVSPSDLGIPGFESDWNEETTGGVFAAYLERERWLALRKVLAEKAETELQQPRPRSLENG